MKPFIVLIAVFGLTLLITRFSGNSFNYLLAGNITMAVMLLFTSTAHFAFAGGMAAMIPAFVPFKRTLVLITGIFEIVAGIALLFPRFRVVTGWLLIVFFILMLPTNISAALQKVDYQKNTLDGPGPAYLWFRIPLQILFISWVYLFSIWLSH